MALYSDPPPLRQYRQDKPTLLVCWWITIFCAVIITLRVVGRFIRTEKLFREDKTAALALVPLFLRMGVIHVVLTYGTNNAQLQDAGLTDDQLHKKSIASGLVLLSRILYAATLWVLKYAIVEFFRRLGLSVTWRRTYEQSLRFVRVFLIATFIAVVISDLTECRPFSHYWQVLPDPGGQCRQGYAQLLTMAVCNIVTDLMLVLFPVPVILSSYMPAKRKLHLVLLFSLSLAPVIVTIYRVPRIFSNNGSQQTRSLYASVELLFATAAANALVLGSFVRDRGVKKQRFKYASIAGTSDRTPASEVRRPTVRQYWGSDEDLVGDLGIGVTPELRETQSLSAGSRLYVPASPVHGQPDFSAWRFPAHHDQPKHSPPRESDDSPTGGGSARRSDSTGAHRRVSFFDPGGLLNDQTPSPTSRSREESSSRDASRRFDSTIASGAVSSLGPGLGSGFGPGPGSGSGSSSNPSPTRVPEPAVRASRNGFLRGSAARLQDFGGLWRSPTGSRSAKKQKRRVNGNGGSSSSPSPPTGQTSTGESGSPLQQDGPPSWEQQPQLMDIGGLLGQPGGKQQ